MKLSNVSLPPGSVRLAALIVTPLAVNVALWTCFTKPRKHELALWRDTHALREVEPKLAALLTEGQLMLQDWDSTSFTADDPARVTQTISRLAEEHRVKVSRIQQGTADSRTVAGHSTMEITLDAEGGFSKLARWISDLESQAGLQVDEWTLSGEPETSHSKVALTLTAFLKQPHS